jgi:hypothetical protein
VVELSERTRAELATAIVEAALDSLSDRLAGHRRLEIRNSTGCSGG